MIYLETFEIMLHGFTNKVKSSKIQQFKPIKVIKYTPTLNKLTSKQTSKENGKEKNCIDILYSLDVVLLGIHSITNYRC